MAIYQPDIVVVEAGENPAYTIVVEVKTAKLGPSEVASVLGSIKRYMSGMACSLGMLVTPDRLWVLRETFRDSGPESVALLGDYRTPDDLRSLASRAGIEFEAEVQRWLEQLPAQHEPAADEALSQVLEDEVVPVLRIGEIRSGNPQHDSLGAVG